MPIADPSLELLIDNLIIFPNDIDLRKSVRNLWEQQFVDIYPDVIKQGIVLRASLPSLSGEI